MKIESHKLGHEPSAGKEHSPEGQKHIHHMEVHPPHSSGHHVVIHHHEDMMHQPEHHSVPVGGLDEHMAKHFTMGEEPVGEQPEPDEAEKEEEGSRKGY